MKFNEVDIGSKLYKISSFMLKMKFSEIDISFKLYKISSSMLLITFLFTFKK